MFPEIGWVENPTEEVVQLITSYILNKGGELKSPIGNEQNLIVWTNDVWFAEKEYSDYFRFTNEFILQTLKIEYETVSNESQGTLGTNKRRESVSIAETQFGGCGEGLKTGDRGRRASIRTFE